MPAVALLAWNARADRARFFARRRIRAVPHDPVWRSRKRAQERTAGFGFTTAISTSIHWERAAKHQSKKRREIPAKPARDSSCLKIPL